LCPSTTIEAGLLDKFRALATDADLLSVLPAGARFSPPRIINASESISEGSICIENYHAVLEHVGSSIRDSLWGKGARVAVLNDEAHHVANESDARVKRWKEFLTDPGYGFRYIVGVSGTCYVGNDYFADVLFRYSLREAMEQRYVKWVDYVAEMPKTGDPDEKWQLVHNRHAEAKRSLRRRRLLPLTIVVTPSIARAKDVADELKAFLVDTVGLQPDTAEERVMLVYNGAPDIARLPYVDARASKVEWMVSVSMLNEGWDVKRVFQIVPHEERAFNSKLLIAQVLGRGLRVPENWQGEQPRVVVFNHDAWANRIKDLVNEVLDIEKRISVRIVGDSPHHFDLVNIDYTPETTSVKKAMEGKYTLFAKGYVDLPADVEVEQVDVEFERAATGERYKWQTSIRHKTYTPREIAVEMHGRLEEAQDPDDPDPKMRTVYTDEFPVERLEKIIRKSLKRANIPVATDVIKQKFLQALGTLRRKASENVRYVLRADRFHVVSTRSRPVDSAGAAELRRDKTLFCTHQTRATLVDEQVEFFDELSEPGAGYKCVVIQNYHDFKSPLNAAIADSENERRFFRALLDQQNVSCYDAWIKSTPTRFYEIDYAWKKGEHPKRGKFSPDCFIKAGDLMLVVEIKGDEELVEPPEETRKKNEYALAHFERVNSHVAESGSAVRYKMSFLTPGNFNIFFQYLREGRIADFRSELDVKLSEES
jgi:type III restriction enzyme